MNRSISRNGSELLHVVQKIRGVEPHALEWGASESPRDLHLPVLGPPTVTVALVVWVTATSSCRLKSLQSIPRYTLGPDTSTSTTPHDFVIYLRSERSRMHWTIRMCPSSGPNFLKHLASQNPEIGHPNIDPKFYLAFWNH